MSGARPAGVQTPNPKTLDVAGLAPAVLAAAVLAVDPLALGGAVVRGDAASAKLWSELVLALAGASAPVKRVPLSATLDRLCGGLDLAATLQLGAPVLQPGLLAEAHGGWLALPGADRIAPMVSAEVCAALDRGWTELARDGFSHRAPARFAALALDEGRDAEEAAPAALYERLALHVELDGAPLVEVEGLAAQVFAARARLAAVSLPKTARAAVCAAALSIGEPSLRAARACTTTARILAALAGRRRVIGADIAAAAALVLAPRARHAPPEPGADSAPPSDARPEPQTPPQAFDRPEPPSPQEDADPAKGGPDLEDLTVAAVRAALPQDVLSAGAAPAAASRSVGRGRGGRPMRGAPATRGAPAGVRRAGSGARRLALVDTLKAAAPWQRIRAAQEAASPAAGRIRVRPGDFRVQARKPPQRGAVLFVVDASGSAAVQRLAEAKGAVELLLADCYARRDQVALISFRQATAEVLLPPTRSLTRVRRRLGEFTAGGPTPLAHALETAARLGVSVRARGERPLLVFMSDARANVARGGEQGRAVGAADALAAARDLAATRLDSVFIDISPRGEAQADAVAKAMGARYLRLPHVQAEAVADAVRAARREAEGARA